MTLTVVLYANQESCLIVISSVSDVDRTPCCYRGGASRDQLNNGFEQDRKIDTTLFNYAGHTQQKLVSRWGVGKHVRMVNFL